MYVGLSKYLCYFRS